METYNVIDKILHLAVNEWKSIMQVDFFLHLVAEWMEIYSMS